MQIRVRAGYQEVDFFILKRNAPYIIFILSICSISFHTFRVLRFLPPLSSFRLRIEDFKGKTLIL